MRLLRLLPLWQTETGRGGVAGDQDPAAVRDAEEGRRGAGCNVPHLPKN